MATSDLKNRILAPDIGFCVHDRYLTASPSFWAKQIYSMLAAHLQASEEMQKGKYKTSHKENTKPFKLRNIFFSSKFQYSQGQNFFSRPDTNDRTPAPNTGMYKSHTYQESEVFMTQSFSVRNLENQGDFWNKFLWFMIFHFLFFSVSPLCIKKSA